MFTVFILYQTDLAHYACARAIPTRYSCPKNIILRYILSLQQRCDCWRLSKHCLLL